MAIAVPLNYHYIAFWDKFNLCRNSIRPRIQVAQKLDLSQIQFVPH